LPSAIERRKKYIEDIRKVVQQEKTLNARFARFNNIGIPRSGKTIFWRRLTGKDVDYGVQHPSTGVAEYHSQVILDDVRKEAAVEMCMMLTEGNVWKDLDYAEEVSLIKDIFSDLTHDISSIEPQPAAPATGIPTDTSTATQIPHVSESGGLSTRSQANTEVEDLAKVLVSLLQKSTTESWDESKAKYQLENIILLSSADTGGHIEFQDMHAALISGPSFNLLFYRLCDDLNERFKVYFTKQDTTSTSTNPSDSTVKNVLFQALASITCFGNFCSDEIAEESNSLSSDLEKVLSSLHSRAMFVGTFLDKLKDRERDFKKKDQELQDMVRGTTFEERNIIREAEDGQLMIEVGRECGMDMNEVREILRREVKDFCKPLPIPASWFILSLCLRIHKSPTMSLTDCEALARKLKIDPKKDLKLALWFLHHGAGVLHYYPEEEVPEVKDIVFCRAQVVYNCVTKIITAYGFEKVNKGYAKFRKTGIFSLKDIKEDDEYSTVPLRKFVKILEYLNIITPRPPKEKEYFFMPCVLESLPEKELKPQDQNPLDPPSLMLRYECGYTPVGVFPALVTNLVSRQHELNWEFMDVKKAYKNKVHFRLQETFDSLFLISHLRYFEIVVHRKHDNVSDPTIGSVCGMVRKVVRYALDNVISRMHYKFTMKSQLGFKCPHSDDDHVHPATIDPKMKFMECSEDKEKSWCLEDKHKMWFTEMQGKQCGVPEMLVGI
jgi:GTPase SAR1 family protein